MKFLHIFLIFLGILLNVNGLDILAIFPLSMKSHYAIGFSVIKSLLDVGHNVTAISTIKPDKQIANYRVIPIPDVMKEFQGVFNSLHAFDNIYVMLDFCILSQSKSQIHSNTSIFPKLFQC